MRKIFVEIDSFEREHIDTMEGFFDKKFIFDEIIEDALFCDKDALIKSIADADEVYIDSALIQLSGAMLENTCYHAVDRNWTGKKLFIFREFGSIRFGSLHHTENLIKVFSDLGNVLYCISDQIDEKGNYLWRPINTRKEIEEY